MDNYEIHDALGKGSQGIVYKVVHRLRHSVHALKISKCNTPKEAYLASQEYHLAAHLDHPNIVPYTDFFFACSDLSEYDNSSQIIPIEACFELKYCENGSFEDLYQYCRKNTNNIALPGEHSQPFFETDNSLFSKWKFLRQEALLLSWLGQMIDALIYLDRYQINHRDIKPGNFFLSENFRRVQLGDFGVAVYTSPLLANTSNTNMILFGNRHYAAPELLDPKLSMGENVPFHISGLWSIGLIFLEFITLYERPFNDILRHKSEVLYQIVPEIIREGYSPRFSSIIRDLLLVNPQDRPSYDIIRHRLFPLPYFKISTPWVNPMKEQRQTITVPSKTFPTLQDAILFACLRFDITHIHVAPSSVHYAPIIIHNSFAHTIWIIGGTPQPLLVVNSQTLNDSYFKAAIVLGKEGIANSQINNMNRYHCVWENWRFEYRPGKHLKPNHDDILRGENESKIKRKMSFSMVRVLSGSWLFLNCRFQLRGKKNTLSCFISESETSSSVSCMDCHVENKAPLCSSVQGGYAMLIGERVACVVTRCIFIGWCGEAVIRARYGASLMCCGNIFFRNAASAILGSRVNGTICGNRIFISMGCGIIVRGSDSNITVTQNHIDSCKKGGIVSTDGISAIIKGNIISNCRKALLSIHNHSSPHVVQNRFLYGNETGIHIENYGCGLVEKNIVTRNLGAGMLVTTHASPVCCNNNFICNKYEGLWITREGKGIYFKNTIHGNGRGDIDLDKESGALIEDNLF